MKTFRIQYKWRGFSVRGLGHTPSYRSYRTIPASSVSEALKKFEDLKKNPFWRIGVPKNSEIVHVWELVG